MKKFLVAPLALIAMALPLRAQNGLVQVAPLGFCQITALSSATKITPANCVRASFTGTGSGTNLTASSVTGIISRNDQLAGTGVPAGTFIVSQISGVVGGAGVYQTSNATTSNAASLTSGGVPINATSLSIVAETQAIRYRDDNQAPTATVGTPLAVGQLPQIYSGSLNNVQFIEQTASAKIDLAFYK